MLSDDLVWHPKFNQCYRLRGIMHDPGQPPCIWAMDDRGFTHRFADGMAMVLRATGHTTEMGEPLHEHTLVRLGTGIYLIDWGHFRAYHVEGEAWVLCEPEDLILAPPGENPYTPLSWRLKPFYDAALLVYPYQRELKIIGPVYQYPKLFFQEK